MNQSAITTAARDYIAAQAERQEARQRLADAEKTLTEAVGVTEDDDDTRAIMAEGWVFIFRHGYLTEALPVEGGAS